jgi:hypothetical protein
VVDTLRRIDLKSAPNWEQFDPKGKLAGPREYPDYLTGLVEWARTYQEGPVPVANGAMGLSVFQMQGDATDWYEREKSETEIIVLFEGTAQIDVGNEIIEVEGPDLIVCLPGHKDRWKYTSSYRGVYAIIW